MIEELKDRILDAALPHVAFDGWSEAALKHGLKDAGLTALDAYRAFPGGAGEMVDYFCARNDRLMVDSIDREAWPQARIRDRIAALVWARLMVMEPHREAVRRTLSYYSFPPNAARGLRRLYDTVNLMWYEAGDTATDFNFYSKRSLLAAVYSSTLLYWLEDHSPDYEATYGFLERRIADVMKIPALKARAGRALASMWRGRRYYI